MKELNEKGNQIIKLETDIKQMTLEMKKKEKEFENNLNIEKQKYINLEKHYKDIIKIKDEEIKKLEEKNEKIKEEIRNKNMQKKDEGDITKIKNENIQLKLNLGIKEKQLNNLNSKLKEFDKDSKIPKLKEIFKTINKTVTDYSELVKKIQENKELFFRDKFIEKVKSQWQEKENDWRRELNDFKEVHFKTMINNLEKEIELMKKENEKIYEEKISLKKYLDNKDLEITKLQQKVESINDIVKIKDNEINNIKKNFEMQSALHENKVLSMEKNLNERIIQAQSSEDEIENIIRLIESISKREKRQYDSYFKKINGDTKNIFLDLIRNLNIVFK